MIGDTLINDVSLDGFHTINGGFFLRQQAAQMTLWKNAIQFNTVSYMMLSRCASVKMLLNIKTQQILIQPCSSKEPDAVAWLKNPEEPRTQKITCESLTKQLYKAWSWDPQLHYVANGSLVQNEDRLMLLFDFSDPEVKDGVKSAKPTKSTPDLSQEEQ